MLTGRSPFAGKTAIEIVSAMLRDEPQELPAEVPPALRQIVSHCLEKNPAVDGGQARTFPAIEPGEQFIRWRYHLTGQPFSFTVQATDETGSPIAQVPVLVTVLGVNPQQVRGTTDSTGRATMRGRDPATPRNHRPAGRRSLAQLFAESPFQGLGWPPVLPLAER